MAAVRIGRQGLTEWVLKVRKGGDQYVFQAEDVSWFALRKVKQNLTFVML